MRKNNHIFLHYYQIRNFLRKYYNKRVLENLVVLYRYIGEVSVEARSKSQVISRDEVINYDISTSASQ